MLQPCYLIGNSVTYAPASEPMSKTHSLCPSKGYLYEKTIDNSFVKGNLSFGGYGSSNRTRVVQTELASLKSNHSLYGDFRSRTNTSMSDIKTYYYLHRLQLQQPGLSVWPQISRCLLLAGKLSKLNDFTWNVHCGLWDSQLACRSGVRPASCVLLDIWLENIQSMPQQC